MNEVPSPDLSKDVEAAEHAAHAMDEELNIRAAQAQADRAQADRLTGRVDSLVDSAGGRSESYEDDIAEADAAEAKALSSAGEARADNEDVIKAGEQAAAQFAAEREQRIADARAAVAETNSDEQADTANPSEHPDAHIND